MAFLLNNRVVASSATDLVTSFAIDFAAFTRCGFASLAPVTSKGMAFRASLPNMEAILLPHCCLCIRVPSNPGNADPVWDLK